MRNIILILFTFLFFTQTSEAQWYVQQSGTTNPLYDIEFINRSTGWSCGEYSLEYDQMTGYPIVSSFGSVYTEYVNATYQKKSHVKIYYPTSSTNTYEILNTNGGSFSEVSTTLTDYKNIHYAGGTNGYLCSIDSVTNNVIQNELGRSSTPNTYSFFYTGKNLRTGQLTNEVDWLLVHELGHQIHIQGHSGHGGVGENCCSMWDYLNYNSGCVNDDIYLCDNHSCEIYDSFNSQFMNITTNIHLVDYTPPQKTDLDFEISTNLEKDIYIEGEEIWLVINIKNTKPIIDSLPYANEAEIFSSVRVENIDKNVSLFKGDYVFYSQKPYTSFKPFEEITYRIPLLDYYGFNSEKNFQKQTFGKHYFFPEGRYKVQSYVYDISEEVGILESGILYFQVKTPQNNELVNLKNLREIHALRDAKIQEKELKVNRYKMFLSTIDSSSVYFEEAFCLYLKLKSRIRDLNKVQFINEYENFINLFPNSNNLPSIVYMLTDFMIQEIDNKEIILSNLNKLKNKHLESLASEEIDKIIYRKKLK